MTSSHCGNETDPAVSSSNPRRTWLLLLCFSVVIAVMRLHTFHEPTERDEATYAVIAHELLAGKQLYVGVLLDQKPPAIHASYAIAEQIVGYGPAELYLLGVGAAIATMLGFYFAGRAISASVGLWTAAFWTLVNTHLTLEANQPNSEVFINAWTILALIALFRSGARRWTPLPALLSGCCFAAASFYKHVVVVVPAFVLLAYVCFPPIGRRRREAIYDAVIIGAIGALAWIGLFGYFAATGRWHGAVQCLILYNQHYSAGEGSLLAATFSFEHLFPRPVVTLLPLFIFAFAGTVFAWKERHFSHAALLTGLAVGTELAVALPHHFFPHYYQLWLPFLLLGTAKAIVLLRNQGSLGRFLAPMMAVILLIIEVPSYFKSAEEWSRLKYGYIFIETKHLAQQIQHLLRPGETFWQLGSEPQLYFDNKQRPPAALADYGMFSGPLATTLSEQSLEMLKAQPPDMIVVQVGTIRSAPPDHPIVKWLYNNYSVSGIQDETGRFKIWARNGSPFYARTRARVTAGN